MTNNQQYDPEHLSFNSLRILRFCHLNMFKELHTEQPTLTLVRLVLRLLLQCIKFAFVS